MSLVLTDLDPCRHLCAIPSRAFSKLQVAGLGVSDAFHFSVLIVPSNCHFLSSYLVPLLSSSDGSKRFILSIPLQWQIVAFCKNVSVVQVKIFLQNKKSQKCVLLGCATFYFISRPSLLHILPMYAKLKFNQIVFKISLVFRFFFVFFLLLFGLHVFLR